MMLKRLCEVKGKGPLLCFKEEDCYCSLGADQHVDSNKWVKSK